MLREGQQLYHYKEDTMNFNPFAEKPLVSDNFYDWKQLSVKPYNKFQIDPTTRLRIILANGAEYEAVWFSHRFNRHCDNNDIRRQIALSRRQEQQQQKRIAALKPTNEDLLEHTIGYEQLAVELTAIFAQRETDSYVKQAMNFALIEDFDHLYRYANLLDMDQGVKVEDLVGNYTEVMPARPTISEHRYPTDEIKRFVNFHKCDQLTVLDSSILVCAEQQTMNYYMNQAAFYHNNLGKQLFSEIAMIEEQHVSMYGSLLDVNGSWLEKLLLHEYAECYMYYSLWQDEQDKHVKKIFEEHFNTELLHLHQAAEMLEKYEKKEWRQIISNGNFPELLKFGTSSNIDYVRKIISEEATITENREEYSEVSQLPDDSMFFQYQGQVNHNVKNVASHNVIDKRIADEGEDWRLQRQMHPLEPMRDRTHDNTQVGR